MVLSMCSPTVFQMIKDSFYSGVAAFLKGKQPLKTRLGRLMTTSPLYPCGERCSTGTHNKTVKELILFSAIINGMMMESRLRISNPVGMLSVL